MADLSKRLRDAAIHRETVTPDEHGVRVLSAYLDRAKALMTEAADALDARWQTMESAPRDGTWVLLYRPKSPVGTWERVILGRWVGMAGGYAIDAWCWPDGTFDHMRPEEDFIRWVVEDRVYEDCENFTHWHPLPPPPEDV